MEVSSLWGDSLLLRFVTSMNGSLVIIGHISLLRFVTLMDCSLIIMGDSSLLRYLFTPMMLVSSLWKIVCCWEFVTPMDGSLVIMEGSSWSEVCCVRGGWSSRWWRYF